MIKFKPISDLAENPTPIQEQSIPYVLNEESDLILILHKQGLVKQSALDSPSFKINENKHKPNL